MAVRFFDAVFANFGDREAGGYFLYFHCVKHLDRTNGTEQI